MKQTSHWQHCRSIGRLPDRRFLQLFAAAPLQHGGYYVVKLALDAKIWLRISRPRRHCLVVGASEADRFG